MKRSLRTHSWRIACLSICLIVYLFAGQSFAAEEHAAWRETYDLVMRWLNFIIFAAIIVKLGGKPLKAFIGKQREEVSTEIELLEKEKKELQAEVDQTVKLGEDSKGKLEELKERILAEGQRRKTTILEEANSQSVLMIEDAKRKAEFRIAAARKNFRKDLIDTATEIALKKLPEAVSIEDQEKRLNQFMAVINAS